MAQTKQNGYGGAVCRVRKYSRQAYTWPVTLPELRRPECTGRFFSAVKNRVRVYPGILDAEKAVISRDYGAASGADEFETGTLLTEWYLTSGAIDERQSLSAVSADFPLRVITGLHLVLFPLSSTVDGECRLARPLRELFFCAWCTYQKTEIISTTSFTCDIRFLASATRYRHGFGGDGG